jgi:pimeloyl-ACP methyl ester carboxylesterase
VPTATNGTVRLHWDEQGTGTPVLLIMGHLFPSVMWWPVLPALTTQHRVVWFDNRGTGDSDATDTATLADLVDDARAVMDAAGLAEAHVVGVSMGGGIALQLAYESPGRVRSVVLGCTALKTGGVGEQAPKGTLRYRLPVWLLKPLLKKGLYGPVCPPDAMRRDLAVLAKARWSPKGVRAQDLAILTYDMTPDKVATVDVPALVQHGTADRAVPYERAGELMAALPNAQLRTYEGAGHNYLVDCTEQATADLLAFLAEVERP